MSRRTDSVEVVMTDQRRQRWSAYGACRHSCRLSHAASGCLSGRFRCAVMSASRSGLSVTAAMAFQLRVCPDHRAGLA
jgi:hypothetical protein